MAFHFFVQCERNENVFNKVPTLDTICAALVEKVGLYNWSNPDSKVLCDFGQLDLLKSHVYGKDYLQKVIPIGSIEFVEAVMQQGFGIPGVKPQNIPGLLNTDEFCGRKTFSQNYAIEDVPALMDKWGLTEVFLKSATKSKSDLVGIYKADNLPQTDDMVVVSEVLKLVSEWRVFVFNDMIMDIKHYAGSPWVLPNEMQVKNMVKIMMHGALNAYTLDVGITEDGETVVIEVHNFISCGLYGATMPLGMYAAAYRQELASQGVSIDTLYS